MAGRWVLAANRWVKRVSWVAAQGQPVGCARAAGWVCKASRGVSKAGRGGLAGKSLGIEDWLGDLNQQAGSVLESRGWV